MSAEEQDAHDALCVRRLPIFDDLDVRLVSIRQIDELGRRSSVKTETIWHLDLRLKGVGHEGARSVSR